MAGVLKEAYTIDERYDGELVSINVMKSYVKPKLFHLKLVFAILKRMKNRK